MAQYKKCLIVCGIITAVILLLMLLAFLITYVALPLIYKNSPELQRMTVYSTSHLQPYNPEFDNFKKYNIYAAKNLRINVTENISLGVWHLLPNTLMKNYTKTENFNFSSSLSQCCPVVLYFHENGGNRIKFAETYHVLRRFFHVITFDYRGYADSTAVPPTEEDIVQDSIEVYKWLCAQNVTEIYFWGHALGSALSTHTIAKLREEAIVPMGLFLEAPFTSMRDQIQQYSFYKFFKWLPWYESTMLDPLEENGFILNTTEHIVKVDCPIVILHSRDDTITPYYFSEELVHAVRERSSDHRNITFYLFPARFRYGHYSIVRKSTELPAYIEKHIDICRTYKTAIGYKQCKNWNS